MVKRVDRVRAKGFSEYVFAQHTFSESYMKQKAYASAGVDIDLGNKVKATLPTLLATTHRREVHGKIGGFGGLFALDVKKYREPVLVSSVDGVGTKLKIAFAMNRHDTIGQDLVNHCVNDIAVLGAEPLFFLDYLGTGKLEPQVFTDIIKGFAKACAENNCALIGGETAQMPGFYQAGEYDVSGTIVGVVEKTHILDGKTINHGDVVIGIGSSGLHTNGYSLARKIFFDQLKLEPKSFVPELNNTIGDELLKVHLSYSPLIKKLLKRFNKIGSTSNKQARETSLSIKGMAHITGGGFVDNIPRVLPEKRHRDSKNPNGSELSFFHNIENVLPKKCDVIIRKNTWDVLPIFKLLADCGGVSDEELYQVFNMGIGMVAIVAAENADAILKFINTQNHKAWLIGNVEEGRGEVRVI
jgi:phosphoribosylformylglycinamidine cyclo-ligase